MSETLLAVCPNENGHGAFEHGRVAFERAIARASHASGPANGNISSPACVSSGSHTPQGGTRHAWHENSRREY